MDYRKTWAVASAGFVGAGIGAALWWLVAAATLVFAVLAVISLLPPVLTRK